MKAGAVDSAEYYFQPDYTFQKIIDTCFGYRDSLLIDLNRDSIHDLAVIWTKAVLSLQISCCPQDSGWECFPTLMDYKWINLLNPDLQIASNRIDFSGLSENFIQPLNSNDTINDNLNWSSFRAQYIFRGSNYYIEPTGYWGNQTHFAGVRLLEPNDTLYGWIRINPDSTLRVIDFAFEGGR